MISEELKRKIDGSIKLLRAVQKSRPDEIIEVAYSGGKDSDVILQLAKESGINYEAIYKNTTIDPPGTIKHAQEIGATILNPKKTFRQLIVENGLPHRFMRFCCRELKEYKVRDVCVIGVRREESRKRADKYIEPTECRIYSKKERVSAIYPILDWSTKDVSDFLQDRGIKCAPLYYDENGVFHPERRLGCMCCPLASKHNRIVQFQQYNGMVRFYINAAQKFIDNHPKYQYKYYDAFEWFYRDVFCTSNESWRLAKTGLFGKPDFKCLLEEYFHVKL